MQQTQVPGVGCSLFFVLGKLEFGASSLQNGKWRRRMFPWFVLARHSDAASTSALTTMRNKIYTRHTRHGVFWLCQLELEFAM